MYDLSNALHRVKSPTKVQVFYHKYFHNLSEVKLMESYVTQLGFSFLADWAIYMPVEKLISYVEGTLPPTEKKFIEDKYILNVKRALDATQPFHSDLCPIKAQFTLDFRGNVLLCCGVYNQEKFSIGSYLDMSMKTIRKKIRTHPYCTKCMANGVHIYAGYQGHQVKSIYDEIAQEEIQKRVTLKNT
jgi:hypothetical protein